MKEKDKKIKIEIDITKIRKPFIINKTGSGVHNSKKDYKRKPKNRKEEYEELDE